MEEEFTLINTLIPITVIIGGVRQRGGSPDVQLPPNVRLLAGVVFKTVIIIVWDLFSLVSKAAHCAGKGYQSSSVIKIAP